MRNHQKEEIKRRMSHGEILRLNTPDSSDVQNGQPNGGVRNGTAFRVANGFSNSPSVNHLQSPISSNSSSTSVNEYKNVMNDKPDYFKASVMVRSQSSSSNTSRWTAMKEMFNVHNAADARKKTIVVTKWEYVCCLCWPSKHSLCGH